MRSSFTAAVLLSAISLATAQTFSKCNPLQKTCPPNPALATTLTTDFTKGASSDWKLADGTTLVYGANGAEFTISKKTDAPTISSTNYIFFGKVSVVMRAAPGRGIVSSFILESDDLDEVDWEWIGSTDTLVQSNFFGKGNTTTYDRGQYHNIASPIDTYHTYTIEWTAKSLIWSIDNNVVRTLNYGDALALGGKNYPQTPMRVKMGSWIGCASIAAQTDPQLAGTCSWAGGAVEFSQAPFTQYVKSVSIQDYGCGSEYSYSDNSGSWQSIRTTGDCGGQAVGGSPAPIPAPAGQQSSAAIFAQTSVTIAGLSPSATPTHSDGDDSHGSAASNKSTTLTTAKSTTLTTANPSIISASGLAASQTAPSETGSAAAVQVTDNAAASTVLKHKYGVLDVGVLGLGLALGYLVM